MKFDQDKNIYKTSTKTNERSQKENKKVNYAVSCVF